MDGSLFAFAAEVRDVVRAQCCPSCPQAIRFSVHEKMPTSRLGEEAGTHRVDGGVRSAVASRLTTLPIDDSIVLHSAVLGSWFIVSNACVVPLPAATVCYTLALLSGPDGRAMCCLQHA